MGGSTTANLPPNARISTPVCWVLSEDTVSKTALIGAVVIFAISFASSVVERLRSRTAVAPIDFRYSVFLRDAVVIIGEKPEILASWIAGRRSAVEFHRKEAPPTILANRGCSTEHNEWGASIYSTSGSRSRRSKP